MTAFTRIFGAMLGMLTALAVALVVLTAACVARAYMLVALT